MIQICLTRSRLTKSWKNVNWNWKLLSVVIIESIPYVFIQFSNIDFVTVSAEIFDGKINRLLAKSIHNGKHIHETVCIRERFHNIHVNVGKSTIRVLEITQGYFDMNAINGESPLVKFFMTCIV